MDVTLAGLPLTGTDSLGVLWILDRNGVVGWGSPATTIAPVQKPRQDGAWGGLAYRKPRSIVMSGSCVAPTEGLALDALDRLSTAVSPDGATLTVVKGLSSRWATVRQDGEVLPTWAAPNSFDWSIQLVAVDPRKFAASLTGTTSLPSTTGGLTIPYTIPYAINATTVTGQVSLTNPGNASGPVLLQINGPITGPTITHVSTGQALTFASSLSLAAGEFITVDMERREVLAQGQAAASRNAWVTARGWSAFDPGVNTWALSAPSYAAGTLQVTATPAWQ